MSCCNHDCLQGRDCPCRRKTDLTPPPFDRLSDWVDGLSRALLYIGLGMALCATIILSAVGMAS
jgi:hypothetical protein